MVNELVNTRIPQSQIVLAFQPADVRKNTEFAIA
ncbi:hypothetical protein CEN45_15045 [Fischerella thermalis CCMEE 5198]|nr:element excision factor XisI family protein [Fischerella thermalis]PLZ90011.1 hypothetical protein CI594_19170 [Fischerella thermalis CCMEE 5196]PMB21333.1 hypothetical protein CEN45_15045 [Fischerella thermalis CCMEE 5198]PMB45244.1 hypothetical protein CEN39_27390 [Fischerella thermalis CCMEE 5201]